MPSTTHAIVYSYRSVQYTGSNSADIDALVTDFVIDNETAGVLTATSGGTQFTINTTDWVIYWQGAVQTVNTNTQYNTYYVDDALVTDLTSVNGAITTLQGQVAALLAGGTSVGLKESPTLLLGQSATVAVDIIPAMPNTSYAATAQLVASATVLGSLSITSTSIVDADTVNVTVQNSGLLNLSGVHILVTARK